MEPGTYYTITLSRSGEHRDFVWDAWNGRDGRSFTLNKEAPLYYTDKAKVLSDSKELYRQNPTCQVDVTVHRISVLTDCVATFGEVE